MAADAVLARARRLHERGVEATAGGRPAAGARWLRSALRLLGFEAAVPAARGGTPPIPAGGYRGADGGGAGPAGGHGATDLEYPGLAGRVLISLAHAEAEQGRTEHGLELLDQAERLVGPADRGVLLQQRGLLLLRTGRSSDALVLLDEAVPLLVGAGESAVLARTLLNRAVVQLSAGRIGPAREDLRRCRRLAEAEDLAVLSAKALHNEGYCALLAGDVPAALAALTAAARTFARYSPGVLPSATLDKARALLAAGLAVEAGRELDRVIELSREQRLSQDLAEAELARAQAALDAGDAAAAQRWATVARRRFARRGNVTWAALAELMRIRACLPTTRAQARLAQRAMELAGRLERLRLRQDAEVAQLLAVRALVAAGRTDEAADLARHLPPVRSGARLETRLLRRLAQAEVAQALGRRGAALDQLRRGLATLDGHRRTLGSIDLQTGAATLGYELASRGLDSVLADGSPLQIFDWSERTRAQAFRARPVRAPADPEVAEDVARLRQLSDRLRAGELAGRPDPQVRAYCAELAHRIRESGWRTAASGVHRDRAGFAEVAAELAGTGQVMVVMFSHGGRLVALSIRDGGTRMVALGTRQVVEEARRRLLADLDALAGRRLPTRLAQVIEASVRSQLAVLTDELLAPLRPLLADRPVVLVPTLSLTTLPWGLLPDLRERTLSVVPSASVWLEARRATQAAHRRGGPDPAAPPLLVAGPDLPCAPDEIAQITALYPRTTVLDGAGATVADTLRHLDGASVAHLAAHGHHEPENVLFSRLDLADGPLMAYDIDHLATAPRHVVLSACDVGRTVVRSGTEILGFTAALLYAGTSSVVASVARVPDDAAARVMVAYHRALARGAAPAEALARASGAESLMSFVCFGAG